MNDPQQILIAIGFIAFVVFAIWLNIQGYSKATRLINEWASSNGYSILSIERRDFRKGPFFWSSAKGQLVYFLSVSTPNGPKTCYIRCGSFFAGMLSDDIEVRWE